MGSPARTSRREIPPELRQRAALDATFTTGVLAKLIGVAPRTISKWVDLGRFPNSYRLPATDRLDGSPGDRRIPRQDVINFCNRYGMADVINLLMPDHKRVMATLGVGSGLASQVRGHLRPDTWDLVECSSVFDLADRLATGFVEALVVDRAMGREVIRQVWDRMTGKLRHIDHRPGMLVWLYDGDEKDECLPDDVKQASTIPELFAWMESL